VRKLSGLMALLLFFATGLLAFAQSNSVTVNMGAQNNSGQTGTAVLVPMGDQTQVTLDITPGPAGVQQPAHIHMGSCSNLNPTPEVPLNPVVDGKSVTTVNVSLQQLESQQRAINVHQSAQALTTYVSCGDLPLNTTMQTGAASASETTGTATETTTAAMTTTGTATETSAAVSTTSTAAETTAAVTTTTTAQAPTSLPNTGGFPIEFVALGGVALLAIGFADRLLQRRAR
jgi:hypothetical protein